MSRIGNRPLLVPDNVIITLEGNKVTAKGPKGEITKEFNDNLDIVFEEGKLVIRRNDNEKLTKQIHGTTASLLSNMIEGVSNGFKKELEIIGVGYRFQIKGKTLVINAGYSHPVNMEVPAGLEIESPSQTEIIVKGIDNELVGEFASNIRKVRKPEPYKGKGIRYKDEHVRRKEGKKAA